MLSDVIGMNLDAYTFIIFIFLICLLPLSKLQKNNFLININLLIIFSWGLLLYKFHGGGQLIKQVQLFMATGFLGILCSTVWREEKRNNHGILIMVTIFIAFVVIYKSMNSVENLLVVGGGNYQDSGYFISLLITLCLFLKVENAHLNKIKLTTALVLLYYLFGTGARGPLLVTFVMAFIFIGKHFNLFKLIIFAVSLVLMIMIFIQNDLLPVGVNRIINYADINTSDFYELYEIYGGGRVVGNNYLINELNKNPVIGLGVGVQENFLYVPHGLYYLCIFNFGYIIGLSLFALMVYALYMACRNMFDMSSYLYVYSFMMLSFSGLIFSEPLFLFSLSAMLGNILKNILNKFKNIKLRKNESFEGISFAKETLQKCRSCVPGVSPAQHH